MKQILGIILGILSCSAGMAGAEMVRYVDEEGKSHYVNTDYSRVPDRYYDQVRDQLEPRAEQISDSKTSNESAAQVPKPVPVLEFFTKNGCSTCDKLEVKLRAHKINYRRYDVGVHPYGRAQYQNFDSEKALPVSRIDKILIYGDNLQAILAELNKYGTEGASREDENQS